MRVNKLYRLIPLFCISFYIFHFLFLWMFQTTDSYFYWALANFFRTGQYYAPHPYYYTKPSTMEPPFYSILLFIAEIFPRPDIIIHAFHIGAVLISGLLLSKVLYKITKSRIAWSIGWLFTLLPSNII